MKAIKQVQKSIEDVPKNDLDKESQKICEAHERWINNYFKRKIRPRKEEFNRRLLKIRDDYLLVGIKYASRRHRKNPTNDTALKLLELSERLSDRFEGKPAMKTPTPTERPEGGVVILPQIKEVKRKPNG